MIAAGRLPNFFGSQPVGFSVRQSKDGYIRVDHIECDEFWLEIHGDSVRGRLPGVMVKNTEAFILRRLEETIRIDHDEVPEFWLEIRFLN